MRDGGSGRSGRHLRALALGLAILSVAGCAAREDYMGYSFDPHKLAEIKPGVQNQEQVAAILGSPSTRSTFTKANDTWYYISKQTKAVAFFKPEVQNQRVVAIDFGSNGKVQDIRNYTLSDARPVEPLKQITPTTGRSVSVFQQFFGNVGRFNSAGPQTPGQAPGSPLP